MSSKPVDELVFDPSDADPEVCARCGRGLTEHVKKIRIVGHYDEGEPGHNALNHLHRATFLYCERPN